ncbi:MAG: transcription antitermination factor NusB [Clostridiaceae bacterium]|jgi:N utilization substance protein B|nr:transcription antitermination factor NusB [Clostridiaceae bacterium]
MSRHTARERAFKFLYQREFHPKKAGQQKDEFLILDPIQAPEDLDYFEQLVDGVTANRQEIDVIIEKYLRGWTMERQLLIDLSILRIAIYEMLFDTEVPVEIAISEAVIFANEYGTDESRAFINAVLGNIDKNEIQRKESLAPEECCQ